MLDDPPNGAPSHAGLAFGPAGFAYPDWRGRVYPRGQGTGVRALRWLARFCDLVEVNASFYGTLRPDAVAGWVKGLSDAPWMRFVVKVGRGYSHEGQEPAGPAFDAWLAGTAPLREAGRQVAYLLQFPFSFRASVSAFDRVQRIAAALPEAKVAVEWRHASWNRDEWFDRLERAGFAFVDIDQPALPDCIPLTGRVTSGLGYLRLHGRRSDVWFSADAGRDARYDYRYAVDEILALSRSLQGRTDRAALQLIVGNNHFHGKALAAVLSLVAELRQTQVAIPEALLADDPELLRWRAAEQGRLF